MKKMKIILVAVVLLTSVNVVSADTFGEGANQITIDFVDISGDASSANGTDIGLGKTFFSDPSNDYRMGIYEITNDQWDKFQTSYGTVTGSPSNAYDQSASFMGTNVPTNGVSWYEAAQFVNYLNTSTGSPAAYKFTGTQGTGSYTLGVWEPGDAGYDVSNPFRNSNAFYFMPTQDEWVKAAYWNGTSLQTWATTDGSIPIRGDTNYRDVEGQPWNVGSGSEELNGTFDMMGNVWEWMENPKFQGDYESEAVRCFRGGAYYGSEIYPSLSYRLVTLPYYETYNVGFRVASIPEPCSILLLSVGALGLMRRRKALA